MHTGSNRNLIGDRSRTYLLPRCSSRKHADLACISAETVRSSAGDSPHVSIDFVLCLDDRSASREILVRDRPTACDRLSLSVRVRRRSYIDSEELVHSAANLRRILSIATQSERSIEANCFCISLRILLGTCAFAVSIDRSSLVFPHCSLSLSCLVYATCDQKIEMSIPMTTRRSTIQNCTCWKEVTKHCSSIQR